MCYLLLCLCWQIKMNGKLSILWYWSSLQHWSCNQCGTIKNNGNNNNNMIMLMIMCHYVCYLSVAEYSVLIESTGSWSLSTLNIWLHSILFIIAGLATQNVQLPVLEFLRTCPALKMLKDIICPSPRPWSSRPGHWPGVKSLALTSASCMEVLGNFKDAVTTPITLLSHRLVYRTRCLWTSHHFTVYYCAKHRLFFFCTMLNAPDSPFNRMYYMMWFMFSASEVIRHAGAI